jgi:hypothetical protein
MSYTALVNNLGRLTEIGAIGPGNPATLLVVARLVDRTRIQRSGLRAEDLRKAMSSYRVGRPSMAVIRALEQAIEIALENEAQPAAYSTR